MLNRFTVGCKIEDKEVICVTNVSNRTHETVEVQVLHPDNFHQGQGITYSIMYSYEQCQQSDQLIIAIPSKYMRYLWTWFTLFLYGNLPFYQWKLRIKVKVVKKTVIMLVKELIYQAGYSSTVCTR